MLLSIVVTLWLLAAFAGGWRRVLSSPLVEQVCAACKYDLRGLAATSACPECGATNRLVREQTEWVYSARRSAVFLAHMLPILGFPLVAPVLWYLYSRVAGYTHAGSFSAAFDSGRQTSSDQVWAMLVGVETGLVILAGLASMNIRSEGLASFMRVLLVSVVLTSAGSLWLEWIEDSVTWGNEGQLVALVLAMPLAWLWFAFKRGAPRHPPRDEGSHPSQ